MPRRLPANRLNSNQLRRALRLPPGGGKLATDPLGPWAYDPGAGFERIPLETPEQRAYRRFPINRHKPWEE